MAEEGNTLDSHAKVQALFDQIAPSYDQGGVPWFGPIAARLVALLAPATGERALDIGAGRGAATFPLCAAVGESGHVTAFDLSPVMCDLLRAEADERGITNLDVRRGDGVSDPLARRRFDVAAASLVLFFNPDPGRTLGGWVGLVRPGGRIGLTSFGPIDQAWQHAEDALLRHAPLHLLDARTSGRQGPFATTAAMSALVAACGVTDVDCHDEPLSVVLPDAAAWRAWTNTLGLKAVWDAVPSDQLDDVMEQISDALEADRNEDGALHLTQQVRYATGRVL